MPSDIGNWIHVLSWLAAAGYALAVGVYLRHFLRRERRASPLPMALLSAVLVVHTVWLVVERITLGYLPFARAPEALSLVAWGIALAYWFIERRTGHEAFGAFMIPVVFLFQTVAAVFMLASPRPSGPLSPILQSVWFEIHVGAALFSYCAFAVAFAAGLMHVLLFHELRLKHFGFYFERMPPLDALERINFQAVALGFLFLTVGLASGVVWSLSARAGSLLLDAKEISAIVVWLLYAANVHTRSRLGWRGRRTALFSVINFLLLFVIFFVTSFVLKAHQF
ncbi:MAG: cytochrome c biogenesis protein [Candidatus Sumerlaeia bacterium]|nr:cytochrome c biogenesis protein [Candidatus Sumerlaeia bacterium]